MTWPGSDGSYELDITDRIPVADWNLVDEEQILEEGFYSVRIPFGDETRFFRLRAVEPPPVEITDTSPIDGAGSVAVTRETIIRFSAPLSADTGVSEDAVVAYFGGETLPARSALSSDRRKITLFYDNPLPGGARLRVTINGDLLADIFGNAIDADGDGSPGGTAIVEFTTLSLATIPNTAVVGQVFASELGEENGEPINSPLQGVTITLDGKENTVRTTTDAEGKFKLEPVPSGEFFVHIDGRTATGSQWPEGSYYPFVGKSWKSIPGRIDTLAGGTGVVYLPLIVSGTLRTVSNTEDTEINFLDAIVQEFPELGGVSITVPANSLFNDNGTRGGSVGIAPVPPDRLPGQLPEMLRFPIVITVQTDGATNFDIPAPVRFPNLPDPVTGEVLPPGAKTALWSFNHDSGRWEIQGSMTISEDGLYAVSDPGVGIRAPGWHGVNPGSGPGGGPDPGPQGPPFPPDNPNPPDNPDKPDRPDDDECTMEVICNEIISEAPDFSFCLLNCSGDILGDTWDRLKPWGENPTPRSPAEIGFCGGNVLDCGQFETIGELLNSDKYDDSLTADQTGCMDDCLTPTTNQFKAIVPCEGFVDPCPENLGFSDEEIEFLTENQVFYEIFDLETEILPDWIAEQKALWRAESDYFRLVFGTDKITQTDPLELVILRGFLYAMRDRLTEESEAGKSLSETERAEVLAMQRPSQFDETEWITLTDRIEMLVNNALSADQWDEVAVEAAAQHAHDVTQLLINRGWKYRLDGLIYGLQRLSSATAPEVGSEAFPARSHYYLIHNFETGFDLRGRLGPEGQIEDIFTAPNQYHMIAYVDPVTLNIGAATYYTSGAGQPFLIPTAPLFPAKDADSDGDGLKDSVEKVIGTSASNADTDSDGISDGAEIQIGTNPLDGIPVSTGVIGSAETATKSLDITAINDLVVTANEEGRISFYDVSNAILPINIANMRIAGNASTVSLSSDRLAIGTSIGIVVVNIFDPTNPQTEFIIGSLSASKVLLVGPFLYAVAITQDRLYLYDVYTGELLDQRTTSQLNDLAFADGMLYSMSPNAFAGMHLIEKRPIGPQLEDALYSSEISGIDHPTFGRTHITAGGGYVYLGGLDNDNLQQTPGVAILEDTGTALNLVGLPSPITALDVAIDGSGLLIFNGGNSTLLADPSLGVLDVSDPTNTGNLSTIFDTDGEVNSLVIHNGFAYLADGTAGLKVVNYSSTPPEVNELEVSLDTDVPGSAIESGGWMRVSAIVNSSARVRNVEFYVDGNLAVSDGGYPFEQYVRVPPLGVINQQIGISVRAVTVTGDIALSDALNFTLVDTVPPIIFDFEPGNGSVYSINSVIKVSAFASEILDSALLNSNNFQLLEAGPDEILNTADDIDIFGTIGFNVTTMELFYTTPGALDKGIYKATVAGVSDLSGNILTEADTWTFEVREPNQWIAEAGGSWGVPGNWSEGSVRQGDNLIIDVPNDLVTTILSSGTYQIGSIASEESFTFSGVQLNLLGQGVINGLFTWTGQSTIDGGGTIWANGGISISGTSNKFLKDQTIVNGGSGTWTEGSILLQNEFSQFYNAVGATLEFVNENFVNFVGFSVPGNPVGLINDGDIIKSGSAEARITSMPFQNNGSLDIREGEFRIYNSKFYGKGSTTVRSDARFSFESTSPTGSLAPFLEAPIHLEENATLGLEIAHLISDDGVGITGNGNIEVKEGGQFGVGSILEINGDITANNILITARSTAELNGTTTVQTAHLNDKDSILGGSGDFECLGEFLWTGGTMTGGGTTRLRGPLHMNQSSGQQMGQRNLEIYGDVICEDGVLNLEGNATYEIHVMPEATWTQQNDFEIKRVGNGFWPWNFINEGSFIKEGDMNVLETEVNFENRGSMQLDASFIRFAFGFSQTAEGTLNVLINGIPTEYVGLFSQVVSVLSIELDGALNIQLAENFVPDIGASYRLFLGQSLTGTFATITGLQIAADRKFEIVYNNKEAFLNVVAIP